MKTLTTLTAVAALVAGISFAQAQGTMGSPPSGSGMQRSQTIGNSPFCINTSASGGPELQVCEHGSLREGREASEPELFAKPEQGHDRLQAASL